MRKTSIAMLILFYGLSGTLLAQEQFGFEAGVYSGPAFWQERTFQVGPPQASPPIPWGLRYGDEPVYGVRLNLLSRGYWGGEVAYSYQRNTVYLTREAVAPVELGGGVHHFFYNTVFYPAQYRTLPVTPFFTAGLGLAGYQLSLESRMRAAGPEAGIEPLESIDKRFAFNYGAGVKANLPAHLGVRADFRHIFSDVPSYGLPKQSPDPAQSVLPIGGKLQTYEASAGIYFHFSK